MEQGDRFSVSFDEEGVYPFACTYHPGMTGAIVVDAAATPVAAVRTAGTTDGESDKGGAGGPLAIGLLAVVALGGAFATGTRVSRRA
jgi:hypothetical protein